jgi:polyisoprenoid-binding protein YceI
MTLRNALVSAASATTNCPTSKRWVVNSARTSADFGFDPRVISRTEIRFSLTFTYTTQEKNLDKMREIT